MQAPPHQSTDLIERLCKAYQLPVARFLPSQAGYRNRIYPLELTDGLIVNLTLYKTETDIVGKIKCSNKVSDFLAVKGFPTRKSLGKTIVLQSANIQKYAGLYSYLPGHTIPWEAYTKHHIKLLGKTMSDMHKALAAMPYDADMPVAVQQYQAIFCRMHHYFRQPHVQQAMATKLHVGIDEAAFHAGMQALEWANKLPDQQVLHMDFVRSNILFTGDYDQLNISGILDFEKTAFGSPLFDIARTLAFLLVDCKAKPPEKIRKYFLQSGYHKRGQNPLRLFLMQGESVLDQLIDAFLLHDFYKFLRHNPYEFLEQNQHYTRTRDILLQRQLLVRTK